MGKRLLRDAFAWAFWAAVRIVQNWIQSEDHQRTMVDMHEMW